MILRYTVLANIFQRNVFITIYLVIVTIQIVSIIRYNDVILLLCNMFLYHLLILLCAYIIQRIHTYIHQLYITNRGLVT